MNVNLARTLSAKGKAVKPRANNDVTPMATIMLGLVMMTHRLHKSGNQSCNKVTLFQDSITGGRMNTIERNHESMQVLDHHNT
jgi:hypothetical protein